MADLQIDPAVLLDPDALRAAINAEVIRRVTELHRRDQADWERVVLYGDPTMRPPRLGLMNGAA